MRLTPGPSPVERGEMPWIATAARQPGFDQEWVTGKLESPIFLNFVTCLMRISF
jgi:hypothetical protein